MNIKRVHILWQINQTLKRLETSYLVRLDPMGNVICRTSRAMGCRHVGFLKIEFRGLS